MSRVDIHPDHEAASRAAAQLLLQRVAAHPQTVFHLGLSGGSTPRRVFELLGEEPIRSRMPWGDLRFWFVDERCVPRNDPRSNYRLAYDLLLRPLEIPPEHVFAMPAHLGPGEGAQRYHELLAETFGPLPVGRGLDLALLGMGADGHTASLFPGHPALESPGQVGPPGGEPAWALPVEDPAADPAVDRVSLTLAALNASACAVLLVTGPSKAAALGEALRTAGPQSPLPAGRVQAEETVWIVDREAADG